MGTFNDHPKGVQPSGWKRGASKGDDMVCSTWRHVAVRKNGDGLANRPEHKVKRAGFMLGIGRELYTAPFVWVPADKCTVKQGKNGRMQCYDKFRCEKVRIESGQITGLSIYNDSKGCRAYVYTKD